MTGIITLDRSIIPACDVPLDVFERLVGETAGIRGIGAYKVGPALTGRPGYDTIVSVARKYTNKPLIYDAQKWGTDIPDTAIPILRPLKESGIDTVILFPQAGPETEKAWIQSAQDLGLGVIVGGLMTHKGYLYSEGGWINDTAARQTIYTNAFTQGVRNFVVPGNKPQDIRIIRDAIEGCDGRGDVSYFAPGFVAQGGAISEGGKAAGERFHAIVGRGIYEAKDMRKAAEEHCSQLGIAA